MAASVITFGFIISAILITFAAFLQLLSNGKNRVLCDLILYGKLQKKVQSAGAFWAFLVPKRYFLHFYVVGFAVSLSATVVAIGVYTGYLSLPAYLTALLEICCRSSDNTLNSFTTVLTLTIFTIHVLRRLYETSYISVFSDGRINIFHYAVGILFYPAVAMTILSEGPALTGTQDLTHDITFIQILGLVVLTRASYQQHQTFRILAQLRTDGKGKVSTTKHFIPHGGLFQYVSSPHYTMELLIYLSLALLQNLQNVTFYSVLIFVIANQTMCALLTHQWYKSTFSNYPKDRTALIPYIL